MSALFFRRMKPTTTGEWSKIAKKHYRHVSGVEVRYNCNRWAWEVIGGPDNGRAYAALWVAQHSATKEAV